MTRCDRLADLFRSHPGEWLDGRQLADVGGAYAWRTRISDLRRAPYGLTIDNRVRRVTRSGGATYQVSEYRYVPAVAHVEDEPRRIARDDAPGLLF